MLKQKVKPLFATLFCSMAFSSERVNEYTPYRAPNRFLPFTTLQRPTLLALAWPTVWTQIIFASIFFGVHPVRLKMSFRTLCSSIVSLASGCCFTKSLYSVFSLCFSYPSVGIWAIVSSTFRNNSDFAKTIFHKAYCALYTTVSRSIEIHCTLHHLICPCRLPPQKSQAQITRTTPQTSDDNLGTHLASITHYSLRCDAIPATTSLAPCKTHAKRTQLSIQHHTYHLPGDVRVRVTLQLIVSQSVLT